MKIGFKILIVLLSVAGCSKNQSVESDSDSVDIYAIINSVLTDTSMHWKSRTRILSEFTSLPPTPNYNQSYLSYLSDILSESDTICILRQTQGAKLFTTKSMTKYGFTVINLQKLQDTDTSQGDFWERYHKEYTDGYVSVSKPIFNCARTKVFVRIGFFCESKCGHGTEVILERVKGIWILKTESPSWVS